jgi:hypothetical protein
MISGGTKVPDELELVLEPQPESRLGLSPAGRGQLEA